MDLAELCTTPYFVRYRLVSEYLAGRAGGQARHVAESLRVLVEGYYKLRFPRHIGDTATLGDIVATMRTATADNPLAVHAEIAGQLDTFNAYASRYHHDNPRYHAEPLREHELRHYAACALSLIHDDGRSQQLAQ